MFQRLGGGGDRTIPSPGRSLKPPFPGIGLHDLLHCRQACPESNSFHQGVGQMSPREGLFSCRSLSKRGQFCDIPAPPQSFNYSSAGTGLETPGQQCPSNEGTWDQGRTTASDILTAGVGSSQGGNISSPTERAKITATIADISSKAATPENRKHKTTSKENKQFDPCGKGEKVPPWNAVVTLLSFSGESWEAPWLCSVCFSVSALCVLCLLSYCSFQVVTSQRAERHEGRRGSSR